MVNTFYSEEYLDLIRLVHSRKPWGSMGGKNVTTIGTLCKNNGYSELLDYGSGHGSLKKAIEEEKIDLLVHEYDPGVEGKTALPEPCSFVVCIDVLEHIELEYIDNVLDDLKRCTLDKAYFLIDMREASRTLPDGRNAHILIKPFKWWLSKLEDRFNIIDAIDYTQSSTPIERGSFFLERKK